MSGPMEISFQNHKDIPISEQHNSIPTYHPSNIIQDDKVLVSVEVCLKSCSTARTIDVRDAVERMLEKRCLSYSHGPIPVPLDDQFLQDSVQKIMICDPDEWAENNHDILLFWQVKPIVHVFQLNEDGPCEDISGDGQLSSFNEWILPAKEFDNLWESLIYESCLKQRLLRYAATALLFTEKVLFFYTDLLGQGKHLYAKHWRKNYQYGLTQGIPSPSWLKLTPIHCSANGFLKVVAKLFEKIQEMIEEENTLVFVLIDEVESLAAARKSALSGSEPSDSIRVVNALLTQMDKLKYSPNVIILTTSNITTAIDIAFVDRADIKAYVGPPTLQARYEILRSCLQELVRSEVLLSPQLQKGDKCSWFPSYKTMKEEHVKMGDIKEGGVEMGRLLMEVADECKGLSGRLLRKLPFLTHGSLSNPGCCDPSTFLRHMVITAKRECSELVVQE